MGFPYIYNYELHLVMVFLKEVMETYGPLRKGRSCKTPKYQAHRLLAPEIRKADGIFALCVLKLKIRSHISQLGCRRIELLLPSPGLLPILTHAGHEAPPFYNSA